MNTSLKIPFYAKAALILISVFALVYTLQVGQHIIIPILYATIVAILLNPVVNFLIRKGTNKIIAIFVAVILAILVVFGILFIISSQLTMFSETLPQLKVKFSLAMADLVHWISNKMNISEPRITTWLSDTENKLISNFAIGEKITEVGRMLMVCVLLPVYLFMILYYKSLLLEFIRKLFRAEHHIAVLEVLIKSKKIIQSYLIGLFIEMLIIAILNSVGLLLIGIDYAIILGITGAILNIIPYLGGILATAIPMLIAFVTKDSSSYPLLVLIVYLFIQFFDNHYVIPYVVAKRVKINALMSVIVVIIGGALWGISGMFVSIPLTAILKVIFDHIEPLKPWGFLLGNIVPTASRFNFMRKKSNSSHT